MRISDRILPDMLVIAFKRGYFCCGLTLLYTVTAMMTVFCINCHISQIDRRVKRADSNYEFGCINFSAINGCMQCQENLLFLIQDGMSLCVNTCPEKYFEYRSKHHSHCRDCPQNCRRCYSENFCQECILGYMSKHGMCYAVPQTHRPQSTKESRRRGKCYIKMSGRWGKCSATNCTKSFKKTMKKKLYSHIKKGREVCRNTSQQKRCFSLFVKDSATQTQTCRRLNKSLKKRVLVLRQRFRTSNRNYRPGNWNNRDFEKNRKNRKLLRNT